MLVALRAHDRATAGCAILPWSPISPPLLLLIAVVRRCCHAHTLPAVCVCVYHVQMKMTGDDRMLAQGSQGREGTLSLWGYVMAQPTSATLRPDSGLPHVALDDAYRGLVLEVVAGSGKGYVGTITSYNASLHEMRLSPAFESASRLDTSSRLRLVLSLSGKVSMTGTTRHSIRLDGDLFFAGSDDLYTGMLIRIREGPGAGYEGIIKKYDAASRTVSMLEPHTLPAMPTKESVWQIVPAAPFTARNHLADCSLPNDIGCGSEGVVWARTLRWALHGARGMLRRRMMMCGRVARLLLSQGVVEATAQSVCLLLATCSGSVRPPFLFLVSMMLVSTPFPSRIASSFPCMAPSKKYRIAYRTCLCRSGPRVLWVGP